MPVTLDCVNTNASLTIDVTTKPDVFFLKDMTSCNSLTCNKRLSYYYVVKDDSILREFENLESRNK
jgi:hypothetical protein